MSCLADVALKRDMVVLMFCQDIITQFRSGTLIENMCSMGEQVRFGDWLEETNLINGGKFWLQLDAAIVKNCDTRFILNAVCQMDFSGEEAKLKVSSCWHKDETPKEPCQDLKVFTLTASSLAHEE